MPLQYTPLLLIVGTKKEYGGHHGPPVPLPDPPPPGPLPAAASDFSPPGLLGRSWYLGTTYSLSVITLPMMGESYIRPAREAISEVASPAICSFEVPRVCK